IFLSKTQVQQAKKTEALLVQHIDNEALYSKMRNFTQGVKQLPYQQTNNITIPSYIPIGETLLSYWELYAFGTIQHMVHQSNIIEINRDMLMQFSQARQLALLHNDIQDVIQQIQDAYTQQNISFNVPAFAEAYQDNSSSSIVYDIDKKKALLTVNISEEIEHVQQKLNDAFLYATLQQQWDGNVSTLLLAYQHITPTTVTCADITALSTSFPMQSLPVDDIECIISQNCTPSLLNVSVDILSSIQETYCTHVRIKEPQQTIEIITLQVDPIQIPDLPTWCCAQTCTLCKEHKVIPVLFIHGHAFNRHNTVEASMLAFSDIQQELEQKGIINRGQWLWEQQPDVVWNFFEQPSSIRSSYYFIWNLQVGSYSIQAQQSERLENYALRLREMIQHITLASGSDEVIVVAHSMGGLVARKYMQLFGEDTIHTLITINTPHYGITHRIARFCSWFGASKECEDMRDDSIFMQRLHLQKMKDTPVYSVVSIGCLMEGQQGDGIVTQDSATWNQANIIIIEGECTDTFNTNLHTDVLDPKKYPQLIDILSDILLHKE
ncbi:MAG: alpha/beta fold hydrolase, partial [Candidatus Woesearchaeota archaeon]